MTTTTEYRIGDTVHISIAESPRWAGTYTVAKVNPTTYRLIGDKAPNGLKAHKGLVSAGPLPSTGRATATVSVDPLPEYFHPGSVVTVEGVRNGDPSQLWVVTGQTGDRYRLFPLGGSDRYLRGIPPTRMKRVTRIDGWTA
jgi:hypothetical protein